ncbi:leucine-rich repeat-containing protein 70-like [Euwallacea similis]|uniref:leucine-rich repeat-containing protein 70-like n=1 Tax=Euwallacea similis TaxID=1736056 RepID=UPI00344C8C65
MARWFPPMVLMFVLQTTTPENDDACQVDLSALKWPQLTCTNVDSTYFENFGRPLNRTHWIKCVRCAIGIVDEKTFNFPKNNISFLELQESQILTLRKFAFSSFFLLKLLNLRGNRIDYLEPKCFAGLKRLVHLDLSSNFLKILTNNIFSELGNLDILNLNRNQIFYAQPYAFAGLMNLKYLYLNHNDLKKLEDRMFSHLSNLKILYIEHNGIAEIHQNAFFNLRNLNYLYLNNNSISFLVQYNFKPLASLVDLQLRSNDLEEIQVSSFNGLKHLKSLYLGGNKIRAVKPYGFIGLDSLIILDLIHNNFSSIDFSYFDKMKSLYILWLNENLIREFRISSKDEVQINLGVIDLSLNNLSDFNYSLLYSKIPKIKELVLANNSFSCDFFTNMYSFTEERNISLCMSATCNSNDTNSYYDAVCSEQFMTTDNALNVTDFSTDNAPTLSITRLYFFLYAFYSILFC